MNNEIGINLVQILRSIFCSTFKNVGIERIQDPTSGDIFFNVVYDAVDLLKQAKANSNKDSHKPVSKPATGVKKGRLNHLQT